jgi:hypothetical protein
MAMINTFIEEFAVSISGSGNYGTLINNLIYISLKYVQYISPSRITL